MTETEMNISEIVKKLELIQSHVSNSDDIVQLNLIKESIYKLMEEPDHMPHTFDEWMKSSATTVNILLGYGAKSKGDFKVNIILMKAFLKEFDDPSDFEVTSKNDIELMKWLTNEDFNELSSYRLTTCILAILIGYKAEKDD